MNEYFDCLGVEAALSYSTESMQRVFAILNARRLAGQATAAAKSMADYLGPALIQNGGIQMRNDIAFLLERGGESVRALPILAQVISEDPKRFVAYKNLADAARKIGDIELADDVMAAGAAQGGQRPLIQAPAAPMTKCAADEQTDIRFVSPTSELNCPEILYQCFPRIGSARTPWRRPLGCARPSP